MTRLMTRLMRHALPLLLTILALPAAAQVDRVDDIRFPPLARFDIPQPQRIELENGMVVLLLEDHELPMVEATALVRAGSGYDPADKIGLAELAGRVLRSGGTERMNGDQLDEWLESRAAGIEVAVAEDAARVTLNSLKKDFPEALRIYADVLRRPAFDAQKLEVERNRAIANVSRQNDDLFPILFREFQEIIYGPESPYGWTETYATLGAIRREDAVAWHRQMFHPDRTILGLVGDFSSEEAVRWVREAFGDWPRGTGTKTAAPAWRDRVTPGIYYAEKGDIPQSGIIMGHLGVRRDHPDYYALEVVNQVLGNNSVSRLFSNIRTKKGLAYAVAGQVGTAWDHPGMAMVFMTTKVETTGAGIEALLEEIRNLKARPPSEAEVEAAKRGLLDSFIFRVDAPRRVLGQQLAAELHGYPRDLLSRYRAGIEAVTPAQVRDAAARHLRPEEFAILVVGPNQGQDKPLTTFGKVTPVDITLPQPPERLRPKSGH
ncbi:MAG TPA: pitrilysin family protein [Thermoanaerobaculia bacterium]|nr:pitrilysin family protein [Thermoanaerobaculia bacterium]